MKFFTPWIPMLLIWTLCTLCFHMQFKLSGSSNAYPSFCCGHHSLVSLLYFLCLEVHSRLVNLCSMALMYLRIFDTMPVFYIALWVAMWSLRENRFCFVLVEVPLLNFEKPTARIDNILPVHCLGGCNSEYQGTNSCCQGLGNKT